MKKLTKREIRKYYKQTTPLIVDIIGVIFGLIFEVGMPVAVLILGITFESVLILLVVFPIVLGIGLMLFRGILYSTVKKRLSLRFNKYKIVRAKCIYKGVSSIDTETGEAATFRYTFKAKDGKIESWSKGVPVGSDAYLVVSGKEVLAAFDAAEYYTDNYSTTLFPASTKQKKHSFDDFKRKSGKIFGRIFLEFWLFGTIVFDIVGVLHKDWILALCGGDLMVFYILGTLIGGVHRKATGIITILYLFINGILFYYLSYTYNHSTAAYIVGTVFILVSLLISFIWYRAKSKKS